MCKWQGRVNQINWWGKLGYPSFIGLVIFLLCLPLETEIFSRYRWLLILWYLYIMQRLFNYNSHKLVLDQKVRRVVPKPKLLSIGICRNNLSTQKGQMYAIFLFISSLHLKFSSYSLRTLRHQYLITQISLDIHYVLWFLKIQFLVWKYLDIGKSLLSLSFNNYHQLISEICFIYTFTYSPRPRD